MNNSQVSNIETELNSIKNDLLKALPYYDNAFIGMQRKNDGIVVDEKGRYLNFTDTLGNYFYIFYDTSINLEYENLDSCTDHYMTNMHCRIVSWVNNTADMILHDNLLCAISQLGHTYIGIRAYKSYPNKYWNLEQEGGEKQKNFNIDNRSIIAIDFIVRVRIGINYCFPIDICKCLDPKKYTS
jgi:hypothetical protein